MAKKCPTGFVCADNTMVWLIIGLFAVLVTGMLFRLPTTPPAVVPTPETKIIMMPQHSQGPQTTQLLRPDIYPEPVLRTGLGVGLPSIPAGGYVPRPYQQIGILTAEGGSSSSAAPDRTILPLYGRELDPRRSRWNYYTRTDGANPVQVPVRVGNRVCDDDTNGCNELFSNDSVHIPALGRSFKATVYRKSIFG